jgi:hypothetical protein
MHSNLPKQIQIQILNTHCYPKSIYPIFLRLLIQPLWSAAASEARRRFPFDTKAASRFACRRTP